MLNKKKIKNSDPWWNKLRQKIMKKMPKIFKLEVPFYLLVIRMCILDKGNTTLAIVLFLLSFFTHVKTAIWNFYVVQMSRILEKELY